MRILVCNMSKEYEPLRVLELYSGIGGMRMALQESGYPFVVIGSYEINTSAVSVYAHNFPDAKPLKPRNILGLTLDSFDRLKPDLLVMSPPCQPFTRQGLKRDIADARTCSFLHVLSLLQEAVHPPRFLLLENVAGFELSETRGRLVELMQKRGYLWQELLLTPTQFGVPNSRLRYYLLAKLPPCCFPFQTDSKVLTEFPVCSCVITAPPGGQCRCGKPVIMAVCKLLYNYHDIWTADLTKEINNENFQQRFSMDKSSSNSVPETDALTMYEHMIPPLSHYLEKDIDWKQYFLPKKTLMKYAMLLDIVDRHSRRSCCFTKGYGHYVEGTGSVVYQNLPSNLGENLAKDLKEDLHKELTIAYQQAKELDRDDPHRAELLLPLGLRHFTAQEVARLMCYPKLFSFPERITLKQKYRVLGNSVNVLIVTSLLLILLHH